MCEGVESEVSACTLIAVRPPILQAAEVTGVTVIGARISFTDIRSPVALL